MKTKIIELLPSRWTLDVIVSRSEEDVRNHLLGNYGIHEEYVYDGGKHVNSVVTISTGLDTKYKGESRVLLILESNNKPHIVVHEIIHVLWHLSKHSGIDMHYHSQEWQAMMAEYLFTEITNSKGYLKIN